MEKQNRKRDIQLVFRVTAEEKAFIQEKMRSIGMTNFREYARRMFIKGYIVNIDWTEIKSLSAELQKIDVNIWQILKHVGKMGDAYTADTEYTKAKICTSIISIIFLNAQATIIGFGRSPRKGVRGFSPPSKTAGIPCPQGKGQRLTA